MLENQTGDISHTNAMMQLEQGVYRNVRTAPIGACTPMIAHRLGTTWGQGHSRKGRLKGRYPEDLCEESMSGQNHSASRLTHAPTMR